MTKLKNENIIKNHIAPIKPTPVYETYWRFACERQEILFRKYERVNDCLTSDDILQSYKFTNAYRAADRVSQYLIRNVIYRDDLCNDREEIVFRILLFKFFNRIETWEYLESEFREITFRNYSYKKYNSVLSKLLKDGRRIYSAAYITPPGTQAYGKPLKHQNHLKLLEEMMHDQLPSKLSDMTSMQQGFDQLKTYPTIGDFLAYQFITDINYSEVTDFSEMEFVVPGPGARDGIAKCFYDLGGLNEPELIRFMAERQEEEFSRLGLKFRNLWGRPLQLIDCQNLFCEVDKYSRVAHPEFIGRTGRTRIKQKYRPTKGRIDFFFPPKWKIPLKSKQVI